MQTGEYYTNLNEEQNQTKDGKLQLISDISNLDITNFGYIEEKKTVTLKFI